MALEPETYSVTAKGSHPDSDEGDNWYGHDGLTLDEAKGVMAATPMLNGYVDTDTAYLVLEKVDVNGDLEFVECRRCETFKPDTGDEWRQEFAHQQGMGHGVEAYNEAMGWEVES